MGLLPGIAHGLLPELMASDPESGIARAGIAITAYALGVVVGAPALALLSVRWSRTTMIMVLAVALAAGTLLSGLMPTFELTVLARFIAGIPHGAYFGVASLLAASLMGPGSQGKGTALALSGLTVANLIGVPILTAIGQSAGWRAVYLLLACVFVATFIALYLTVPHQEKAIGRSMVDELVALKRLQLWIVIGIAAVGFSGAFAVFSYVADITTQVTGAPASSVPWVLAAAGLGMTIGNIVGGITTDRSLKGTLLIGFPLYITALVALFAVAHTSLTALIIAFFVANLVNSSLSPAMQTWMIRIAHRSELLGASMNQAAFNVANALGATLGGAVIAAGFGYKAPMVVAIVLASTGFAMVVATLIALKVRSRRTLQVLREHEETITGSIPVVTTVGV
jgi:DHA1 family inner membrane transport protein